MRVFYFLLLLTLISVSCDTKDTQIPYGEDSISAVCSSIIVSQTQYQNLNPNQVHVMDLLLEEDCLTVTVGISGCDSEHELNMITNGEIAESFPVQITFDFEDLDPQDCEAVFTIEREFDLSKLRDLVDGSIIINFRNSEQSILY